jgi:hypothetical protein
MPAPRFAPVAVVGDDAWLLAELTALIARRSSYLPVLNGPRLQRPDADNEVIRRRHAIAKAQPQAVILAGLPDATSALLLPLPREVDVYCVARSDEMAGGRFANKHLKPEPLYWGRTGIGVGVLRALRSRRRIVFADMESPRTSIDMESSHIVICEDGDLHSQVIAAAYALSIDAGLCVIPEFPQDDADDVLEALYNASESSAPAARLEHVRGALRAHVGQLDLRHKAVTFVTAKLPWGVAFPDVSGTHLFRYPDLGIAIVNAIAAEQEAAPGVRSAVVIAPHSVDSGDAQTALKRLTDMGTLSKALRGGVATVHQAAKTVTLFPYDLLLIATHCSDASGYRCTYEFVDTDGRPRRLVLDETAGAEIEDPRDEEVHVTVFESFVSLDGVDWADREAKAALPVGAAMTSYLALRARDELEPVERQPVERVRASMALRMVDGNYIALPYTLASDGSPIVLNNACGSWHRLAETFTWSGARCYIGTLFSVVDAEAEEVVGQLFGRQLGMPLAAALARAQTSVYGRSTRRPYVMVGCHFQRIRNSRREVPLAFVRRELRASRDHWRRRMEESTANAGQAKTFRSMVDFLDSELQVLDDVEKRSAFRH